MEDDCSWIRRTKFSHRFDSRLTSVPFATQDFQEVQRNSRMSSPTGRSRLVIEQRSSPPHPMGKLIKKSSQPNSSHRPQSASNSTSLLRHMASMKVSDRSSKSERKEAKNSEHGIERSVNTVDEFSIDLSKLYFGPKFSHGAHSKIYHGRYNEEAVAVKMITLPEDDQGGALAASLEKQVNSEVKLLSRLQHTNVIKFVGACTQPPVHFVVTEYLDEGSLRHYLKKLEGRSLSLEKLIGMALDIARGMEYIHSKGVIHRDLKPENVLIDKDFRLKIADFGIACEEGHCDSLTGTYRYMAPEWIKHKAKDPKKKSYGRKVDVYSFGLILWELVAGKIAFEELNPVQAAAVAVLDKNMRPVIAKDCPPAMRALIEQCWSKQPEKRPEFWQVVKVLEQFQSSLAQDGTLSLVKNLVTCQDHKKGRLHWIPMLGQQIIHS